MNAYTFEEINLICYYREASRNDTVAAITAALPYMEAGLKELAERTAQKLKQLTEEEFTKIVLEPTEDIE